MSSETTEENDSGIDPDDPTSITEDQIIETMEASGGFICFTCDSIGLKTHFRYNPARNGFEVFETGTLANRDFGNGASASGTTTTYEILPRNEMLEEIRRYFDSGIFLEPVAYPHTPFTSETDGLAKASTSEFEREDTTEETDESPESGD